MAKVSRPPPAVRTNGARAVFMRYMSLPEKSMRAFRYQLAIAWQRTGDPKNLDPWLLRGSPGFEISPELAQRESGAIFDKLTRCAPERTPLLMALPNCCGTSIAPSGIAIKLEIEPAPGLVPDFGAIPGVVEDVCGGDEHAEAAQSIVDSVRVAEDAILTELQAFCQALKCNGG